MRPLPRFLASLSVFPPSLSRRSLAFQSLVPRSPRRGSRLFPWFLVPLLFLGCGEREDWSPLDGPWDPNHPDAARVLAPPDPEAPIDLEMAEAGERWYRVRGCLACHRLDHEEVVGPSLAGITYRREYEWYRAMVMRPDSMLRNDPVARELLEIYRIPMPDQGVDELRVRAMWEFHRKVDGRGPAGP